MPDLFAKIRPSSLFLTEKCKRQVRTSLVPPPASLLSLRKATIFSVLLLAAALALPLASSVSAQTAYKIGISGAATGPASPSYLPHIESIRTYIRQLNDNGGINGVKVDVVFVDNKASPSEAASNAKRLMDDEGVLAVGLISLSSTYAPMFQG